jgi:hypothetical protein
MILDAPPVDQRELHERRETILLFSGILLSVVSVKMVVINSSLSSILGEPVFNARIEDALKSLYLFSTLVLDESSQKCRITINQRGVTATIEHQKILQGSVFLQRDMFKDFHLGCPELEAWIDLQELLKSIGMDAKNPEDLEEEMLTFDEVALQQSQADPIALTLRIQDRDSESMEVIVEELTSSMTTTSETQLLIPGEFASFPLMNSANMLGKIQIKSPVFEDIRTEFDPSAAEIGLHWTQEEMKFWTDTLIGRQEITLDRTMTDVESYFFSGNGSDSFVYTTKVLHKCFRPLIFSNDTTITSSIQGLLQFQYSVENSGSIPPIIVDFITISKYVEDDPYKTDHPINLDDLGNIDVPLVPTTHREDVIPSPVEMSLHLERSMVIAPATASEKGDVRF